MRSKIYEHKSINADNDLFKSKRINAFFTDIIKHRLQYKFPDLTHYHRGHRLYRYQTHQNQNAFKLNIYIAIDLMAGLTHKYFGYENTTKLYR